MKTIKYINTFAVLLSFFLGLLGLILNDSAGNYIVLALYSTMLTGFIQVILGLIMFLRNTKNQLIIIYLVSVILFFLFWYFNVSIFNSDLLTYVLFIIPACSAIYLTIVIYKTKKL